MIKIYIEKSEVVNDRSIGLSKFCMQIIEYFKILHDKGIILLMDDINDKVDYYVMFHYGYKNIVDRFYGHIDSKKIIYITASAEVDTISFLQILSIINFPPKAIIGSSKFVMEAYKNGFNYMCTKEYASRFQLDIDLVKNVYNNIYFDYVYLYADDNVFRPLNLSDEEKRGIKDKIGIKTKFNFIFNGIITDFRVDRKQIFELMKLFSKSFNSSDDVGLIIKTGLTTCCYTYMAQSATLKILRNHLMYYRDKCNSNIYFIVNRLNDENINLLYNISDAFLSISSGEGFGYAFLEAALCGLPIMALNHSAYIEFLDISKLDYRLERVPQVLIESYNYMYNDSISNFAVVDENSFINKTRRFVNDRSYYNYMADIATKQIDRLKKEGFTSPEAGANKISNILSKLSSN